MKELIGGEKSQHAAARVQSVILGSGGYVACGKEVLVPAFFARSPLPPTDAVAGAG
jgi:hypothetical protein